MVSEHKNFLKNLPLLPGVYIMYNQAGEVLYVGKARRLKQRLRSYFQANLVDIKTKTLVSQIARIETTVTHSEQEALLLENNLIKKYRPRYNVLFRDDKSYPYIFISNHPDFPRMDYYRGLRKTDGVYFGPYPSALAVQEALKELQKLFRIRSCHDHFFAPRTRPCLQYQIKRCTAPCVNYISAEHYQHDVNNAVAFLEGKKTAILKNLINQMNAASAKKDFESAARYRDTLLQMRKIQEQQYVMRSTVDADVVVGKTLANLSCVQILMFRHGQLLGSKSYFPDNQFKTTDVEILQAFLLQYYLAEHGDQHIPKKIIVNVNLKDKALINKLLTNAAHHSVKLLHAPKGIEAGFLKIALTNLEQSIRTRLKNEAVDLTQLSDLQAALNLPVVPEIMECFDISHTRGEETVASCVVFVHGQPQKARYRQFNIQNIKEGDDYAALQQAVLRHYQRAKTSSRPLPDILFVDGGKGQLSAVLKALEELQLTSLTVVAVAKGRERKAGLEKLFVPHHHAPILLAHDSPALHLIQQIRDEAHRFAITRHRQRRSKKRLTSPLQSIAGIGQQRRRHLLQYFGGLQEITQASFEEIAKVPGISEKLARKIYDYLHR